MKKNYSAALAGVTVYRHLLKLPPLAALTRLFRALEQQDGENALEGYTETFYTLTQEGTDSLSDYLVDQLRYGISSYAQAAAHGQAGVVLTQAAERDLAVFASLAALEPSEIKAELAVGTRIAAGIWCADRFLSNPWLRDFLSLPGVCLAGRCAASGEGAGFCSRGCVYWL